MKRFTVFLELIGCSPQRASIILLAKMRAESLGRDFIARVREGRLAQPVWLMPSLSLAGGCWAGRETK